MDTSPAAAAVLLEKRTILSAAFQWKSAASPVEFLRAFPDEVRIFFNSPENETTFAGVGNAVTLKASGSSRMQQISDSIAQLAAQFRPADNYPGGLALPRFFGGFSFDAEFQPGGNWRGFEAASFMLPRCLLVSTHDEKWLVINRVVLEGSDAKISYSEFEDEFEQFEQSVIASLETVPNETSDSFQIELLTSQQEWINAVNAVKWEIQGGGLEKVVLARAKRLYFAGEVDPFIALNELSKQYPDCTKFLFSFSPGSAFLGATPEYLAAVQDGALRTMALAGSIRRGGTPEEDKRLGQQLMGSAKDQREHDFVVNFLRETLGPLANGLAISQEPQLHELQNIQHLRTDVQASLRDGVDILDVVAALHPTPALGGLPRQRALEMIAELETESRGWYGAPVGWLDGHGNGEFVVGIRSGVVQGNQACIYAGAGIVADSDPIGEWHETELKFEPMGKAFTGSV